MSEQQPMTDEKPPRIALWFTREEVRFFSHVLVWIHSFSVALDNHMAGRSASRFLIAEEQFRRYHEEQAQAAVITGEAEQQGG